MLYLDINEEKTLTFEVEINGVGCDEMYGVVRFAHEDIEYGFPALVETNKITALIKPLKEIFPHIKNGTVVEARLDLNTETHYFNPWAGQIKVQAPISVEAKLEDDVKDPKPFGVTAKVVVSEEKVTKTPKKKSIEELKDKLKDKLKNVTEKEMIQYMERAGTKNPQIQQMLLSEARQNAAKGGNFGVFKYIVKTLKKGKVVSEFDTSEEKMLASEEEAYKKRLMSMIADDTVKTKKAGPIALNEKDRLKKKMKSITQEQVYKYMEKEGSKNPQIQEIVYGQAATAAGSGEPYKVLQEVIKILKKKGK